MEFIEDIDKNRKKIEASIKKHGFTPEHYFHYYKDEQSPSKRNIFAKFNNKMGILAQKSKKSWSTISEVLAPENKRTSLFLELLDHVFSKNSIKNVEVEFNEDSRAELLNNPLFKKKYRTKHGRTLFWPVFDMKKWDGDKLQGKKWKKMRNMKNRLHRNHKIEFKHPGEFHKTQLKKIVREWVSGRIGNDSADHTSYYNNIDNGFEGFDSVKVMTLDDKPCAITAGWKIVNSNNYYSCLGLLNYKHPGIGEVSNLQDLVSLKKKGFRSVDFGGSDAPLLLFKKKFRPHKIYKTHQFFIYKR
jgi:hypothetical protein